MTLQRIRVVKNFKANSKILEVETKKFTTT